jgi:DNA-binding transcriptional LysR family regulator
MYPDVSISLLLDDGELDLAMREADVAIRMHPPKQPDLVQRHLMTLQWYICASPDYLKEHGVPQRPEDLDAHKLVLFGHHHPPVSESTGWPRRARPGGSAPCWINSTHAVLLAIRSGLGIGTLPDFIVAENPDLVRILPDLKGPKVDAYFVYPEELRNSKRVAVFRDFLLARLAEFH